MSRCVVAAVEMYHRGRVFSSDVSFPSTVDTSSPSLATAESGDADHDGRGIRPCEGRRPRYLSSAEPLRRRRRAPDSAALGSVSSGHRLCGIPLAPRSSDPAPRLLRGRRPSGGTDDDIHGKHVELLISNDPEAEKQQKVGHIL